MIARVAFTVLLIAVVFVATVTACAINPDTVVDAIAPPVRVSAR